jgi:hypothetical protein
MHGHQGMLGRATAALALVAIGLATHTAGVGALTQGFVENTTLPGCLGVGVVGLTGGSGSSVTTTVDCAGLTSSNLSPLDVAPSPGVVLASVTFPLDGFTDCSSTLTGVVSFSYRDELGTVSFRGSVPYVLGSSPLSLSQTCNTSYAHPTSPIPASGTGLYQQIDILCTLLLAAPSAPPLSEGTASIAFDVRTGSVCP